MRANGIPVGDLNAGINLSATWAECAKKMPKWQNNVKNTRFCQKPWQKGLNFQK